MHTETVDILLHPSIHYLSLSLYLLLFFLLHRKAANMSPVPFWSTWSQEPWIQFAPAHLDSYSGLTILSLVSGQYILVSPLILNQLQIHRIRVSVRSCCYILQRLLSLTWEHCTVLYIPSTKPLKPLSDVPAVWCTVHVQLCQNETALEVTQRKRHLLGDDAAVQITSEDGAAKLHHRMTLHFSLQENTQTDELSLSYK